MPHRRTDPKRTKAAPRRASPTRRSGSDPALQPEAAAGKRRAWCEMLRLVRDEAEQADQAFLAYLVEIAIAHALSLEASHRAAPTEELRQNGSRIET
jgi:hypothetical protein